jgi:anaerobic magnesium-protoporphyrin IX monomethyl ester cyclase
MKVTFVVLGSEQLAVSQLSAIAKRDGHQVGIAFSASLFNDRYNLEFPSIAKIFDDQSEVIGAIQKQEPDVLVFSCLTSTYQWMLGIARIAKDINPNVKTIFGGVHISAVPDRVIIKPEVDYVVVGEGDVVFPLILNAIAEGGATEAIPNTRFKDSNGCVIRGIQQGFIQDLDALPHFDKEIWEDHIRVGDLYLTMASRGCPYTCSFCFNNFFAKLPDEKRGKYVRQRSVDHVMEELVWAKKRYNIKCVDFQDDVFTVNKTWIKEFTERYKKEINVPFQCLIHPKYFDDEMARWLSEAGCTWIQMGIQTMDEKFKHEHLRRYEHSDHIVRSLESMERYGIKAKVDHMLGLPGEPIGSQETALTLYSEHSPKRIQTFWTCFLPGTDLMKQGIEQGLISEEQAERLNEGIDFYFFRNEDNINKPCIS